jgi:hypothetical protein
MMRCAKNPVLLSIFLGFSAAASVAWSPPARADSAQELAAGEEIVLAAIAANDNVLDLMKQIVVNLREKLGICPDNFFRNTPEAVARCMRGDTEGYSGNLLKYLDRAVKDGKLDVVEREVLRRTFTAIVAINGKDIKISDEAMEDQPQKGGIAQPSFYVYRKNKADFAALRKAKGRPGPLEPQLLEVVKKSYPRKMRGVGKITAEQFFAAQVGRLQLNQIAGLMVTATDFMTRPDARILFFPSNYSIVSAEVRRLERQEMELASEIAASADAKDREGLRAQLKSVRDQLAALKQQSKVDALIDERGVWRLRRDLSLDLLATSDLDELRRKEVFQDVTDANKRISALDLELSKLIRTKDISPEDVKRIAVNSLKEDLEALTQSGPFDRMGLLLGDVLVSAWVAGDLSSEALSSLLAMNSFTEEHKAFWKKALEIGWAVARGSLVVFPTTTYAAVAISIYEEARRSTKAIDAKRSHETQLIPEQE